jgi:hypothetical protein
MRNRIDIESMNIAPEAECFKWNCSTASKHIENLRPQLSAALDVLRRDLPSSFRGQPHRVSTQNVFLRFLYNTWKSGVRAEATYELGCALTTHLEPSVSRFVHLLKRICPD